MPHSFVVKQSTIQFIEQINRALICVLLVALLGAIAIGAGEVILDLTQLWKKGLHEGMRRILVDSLGILAIIEVFRTAMAYFAEGRVKVTYIIDTVMVTILTEIMAFWFKEMDATRVYLVIALILTLTVVRVITIRFSPTAKESHD